MNGSVMAGYVAVPVGTTEDDVERHLSLWRNAFAAHARLHGYAPGSVFSDTQGSVQGLHWLMDYIRRGDVVAVLVPRVGHLLRAPALTGADRRTAERYLRTPVVEVGVLPSTTAETWFEVP